MINFDVLDGQTSKILTEAEPLIERTTSRPLSTTQAAHMLRPADQWDWRDLRDYVIAEITTRFGEPHRDPVREASIFKGFLSRWGARAVDIAQTVFVVYGGKWNKEPVSITRFCKNADPSFAQVIADRLTR